MTTYRVILRDGKPCVRITTGQSVRDMRIFKAHTDKPYVRYDYSYIGTVYLDEELKAQLRALTD